MRPVLIGLAVLLAVLLGAFGVTAAVVQRSLHEKSEKSRAAFVSRAETLLPKYLALAAKVDADPFFSAPRPAEDAGPYLNPRVPWILGELTGRTPELALPQALRVKVIMDWGTKWVDHTDEPALDSLDFSWMKALAKYGHWNLVPGGPLEHAAAPTVQSMPRPDFGELSLWARLRLLRARKTGDYAAASAEVRQLAWLCHSTETYVGSMVGIEMLGLESPMREAALAAGADVGDWTPYDDAWIASAWVAVQAGLAYANVALPQPLRERAKAARAPWCLGMTSTTWGLQMRQLAGQPIPPALEADLAHPQPPCSLDLARWLVGTRFDVKELFLYRNPETRVKLMLLPATTLDWYEASDLPQHALDDLAAAPK